MKHLKTVNELEKDFVKICDWFSNLKILNIRNLNSERTIHIAVDMVNGFVKYGALSSKEVFSINDKVACFSSVCQNSGIKNFALCDSHPEECTEFLTYPVHCLKGSEESRLTDELLQAADFRIFPKLSVNGWLEPDFQTEVISSNADTFIITGDCTDMCVIQLALTLKSAMNRINRTSRVIIPANLVATCTLPEHDAELSEIMALYIMKTNGIEIVKDIECLD